MKLVKMNKEWYEYCFECGEEIRDKIIIKSFYDFTDMMSRCVCYDEYNFECEYHDMVENVLKDLKNIFITKKYLENRYGVTKESIYLHEKCFQENKRKYNKKYLVRW